MSKIFPLVDIQKLQFQDRALAERSLLEFLQANEDTSIATVELRPKPESLNSINGIVGYANGERYFFKTHVEENEKLSEYYNATVLAQAGYPVIEAKRIKHRPGQQIALYEIISLPTLFDAIKLEEDLQIAGQSSEAPTTLLDAQISLDKRVSDIFKKSLHELTAEEHAAAPIHQLFSHRLAEDGRLGIFYRNKSFTLGQERIPFATLARMSWTINGVKYGNGLDEIIDRSKLVLQPEAGPAIVGHGDAHNGNLFVTEDPAQKLVMFDPAFAGKHDPLLDITKPLFHNIFARWMYFPSQCDDEFDLSCKVINDEIIIEHSFKITALRRQVFESKVKHLLNPTLQHLSDTKALRQNWKEYLRSALFCCPFLTVNLFAGSVPNGTLAERYSTDIKLLGLSMAMEFGSASHEGRSDLTDLVDRIFEYGN